MTFMLLGGKVDSIVENTSNVGWVAALGDAFLNDDHDDEQEQNETEKNSISHDDDGCISPELLNLLRVCVSDISSRKPTVGDVLRQPIFSSSFVFSTSTPTSTPNSANEIATSSHHHLLRNRSSMIDLPVKKKSTKKSGNTKYQFEEISVKQWMNFWTDAAHTVRIAPQILLDSKKLKNSSLSVSSSSSTANPLEWLLHSSDEFDKVLLIVEGYGDTLFTTTLLMLTMYGSLAQHRLWLSNPDDIRFLIKKSAIVAEDSKNNKKDSTTVTTTKDAKGGGDKKTAAAAASSSSANEFSMIRFFQESSETRPDEVLNTLTKYGGVDATGKRFVFLRDNDLKIVTPSNKLGMFDSVESSRKWTYYHRLRFGRAVENYLLPFYGPLALLQRDPKLTFALTLAAFATFSLQFNPVFLHPLPSTFTKLPIFSSLSSTASSTQQQLFPGRSGEAWINWIDVSPSSSTSNDNSASADKNSSGGGAAVIFAQQVVRKACKNQFEVELMKVLYQRFFLGRINNNNNNNNNSENTAATATSSSSSLLLCPLLNEFSDDIIPEECYYNNDSQNSGKALPSVLQDLVQIFSQQETLSQQQLSPMELGKLISPQTDKATGKLMGERLIWPQLPQFLNYLTSLLSAECVLYLHRNNSGQKEKEKEEEEKQPNYSLENWADSCMKKYCEEKKAKNNNSDQKQQQQGGNNNNNKKLNNNKKSSSSISEIEEIRKRLLPPLLRKAIRQVLCNFQNSLWQMHLGDVSKSVVDFGVSKMFSLSSSSSSSLQQQQECQGLLLALPSDYTAREMFHPFVLANLLSSTNSNSSSIIITPSDEEIEQSYFTQIIEKKKKSPKKKTTIDEFCLDSLCLCCAQPVRNHDAYFKYFLPTTTTTNEKDKNKSSSSSSSSSSSAPLPSLPSLDVFLEALCLFGIYAWDSHPMTWYIHGNEECLSQHLPHYLEMPHSASPGMIANKNSLSMVETTSTQNTNNNKIKKGGTTKSLSSELASPTSSLLSSPKVTFNTKGGKNNNAGDDKSVSILEDDDEETAAINDAEEQQRQIEADLRNREELQLREEIHAQHMIVSLGNGFVGDGTDPIHATGCDCCLSTKKDAEKLLMTLKIREKRTSATTKNNENDDDDQEIEETTNNRKGKKFSASSSSFGSDSLLRTFLQNSTCAKELLKLRKQEMSKLSQKIRESCSF